jgi:hypothetical protein
MKNWWELDVIEIEKALGADAAAEKSLKTP